MNIIALQINVGRDLCSVFLALQVHLQVNMKESVDIEHKVTQLDLIMFL